jgi:peptide/nickel transport system substrate-binding protein
MQIRRWRALAALMLVFVLLGSLLTVHAQGKVLRVGLTAPQNLDPATGSNDPETLFNRSIYDYLIEIKPDRTIAPNLATEWNISDDGLTYTFTLQSGVTFHDGSAFTSKDVVFTFNRLKDVKSPALGTLGDFEVSAKDDSTVVFTLKAPNADFLYGVGSRFALILKDGTKDPNQVAQGDKPYANFNGTGPFVLTDYKEGEKATLTKNAKYWKSDEPKLDGVEFVYISDPATQVNALRGGQVDFIFKISPDQIANLENDSTVTLIQKATNQHPVVRLRTDEGPGKDPRVRQAFKLATDRDQLNELVLNGQGVVGNNDPIGPSFTSFYAKDIQNPKYDPDAAKALLKEAGYADGLTMEFYFPNVLGYNELATVLQQQWKEAGITVNLNGSEEGVYYADDNPNNWLKADLGITGWGDRPTAQSYLVEAYQTGAIYNETHWSDSELDDLIKQAGVTSDTAKRAEIYHKISEIFNERGPIIIPWFANIFGATSAKVSGLDMNPFPGSTDLRSVTLEG